MSVYAMVGITRSKVIFFSSVFCWYLVDGFNDLVSIKHSWDDDDNDDDDEDDDDDDYDDDDDPKTSDFRGLESLLLRGL